MHFSRLPFVYLLFSVNIVWCFLAPVFIVVLIKLGVESPLIFSLKDSIFILSFTICLFSISSTTFFTQGTYSLCLLLYVIANWALLNPEYSFWIANARQILMPVLLIILFCSLSLEPHLARKLLRFQVIVTLAVCLFGFLSLLLGLWEWVGLHRFFSLKGIPVNSAGLSYMFYEPILNYSRRMVSTMLDPISLGHSVAATFIACWYIDVFKSRTRVAILTILGISLLFITSKGALLQVAIACIFFSTRLSRGLKLLFLALASVMIASIPNKTGIYIHLEGLYNSLVTVSPFGFGVGNVGNYAKMFNQDLSIYWQAGISDTYIGSILGQLGWLGALLWFAIFWVCVFSAPKAAWASKALLASILIVSVLSENTLNFSSFYLTAITIGIINSVHPPEINHTVGTDDNGLHGGGENTHFKLPFDRPCRE